MTATSLRALTRKDLACRAKKHQIAGWHEMTKDELVATLAAYYRRQRGRNGSSEQKHRGPANGSTATQPSSANKPLRSGHLTGRLNGRRLLTPAVGAEPPKAVQDSLLAEAHDPCWIHVRWTLSRNTLVRVEAAMGMHWHRAVPILRVLDVTGDEIGTDIQTRVRDVEIHGDVDHWYLPVEPAPRIYKVQIGYRSPNGTMFVMARSNRVHTPRPDSHSLLVRENGNRRPANGRNSNGSGNLSLELEKRPSYDLRALPTAKVRNGETHNGSNGDEDAPSEPPVELRLHAELIVHGTTDPQAELTLLGDRIPVSRDGTFSQRFSLPEGRQVIDAVVTTRNGCHQRTIVLGIERNTKELEPQWFDQINP